MSTRHIRFGMVIDDATELTSGASYQMVNDAVVVVNKTSGSATAVSLPKAAAHGTVVIIKDGKGDAGTNNITISDPNSKTIDGGASLVLNANYAVAWLMWDARAATPEWKSLGVDSTASGGTEYASAVDAPASGGNLTLGGTNAGSVVMGPTSSPLGAAGSVASAGTITPPTHSNSIPVTTAGAVTGVILAAGTIDGQQLTIVNTSANSITFAAAGTSHVADGVSAVIAANRAMYFEWDAATSLWYHT